MKLFLLTHTWLHLIGLRKERGPDHFALANVIVDVQDQIYFEQDNVRTNTESVQCHHVLDIAYLAPATR